MRLSSSRLEATNTLIQTQKSEFVEDGPRPYRREDRWTIKRDFALETNEMRPRSFITQKFFEDLLLLLPCLLLLSPQLLSTCSLRVKINNGRKAFTQNSHLLAKNGLGLLLLSLDSTAASRFLCLCFLLEVNEDKNLHKTTERERESLRLPA